MLVRRPVAYPSCVSDDTPKALPYCVEPPNSSVIGIAAAPVAGVKAGSAMRPVAGGVSWPFDEYCSVCGVPTSTPSICVCTCHSFGLAVLMKYIDCVCVAPSESYTVTEVVWLYVVGSLASNGAIKGGVALPGRLVPTSTVAVAWGG